MSRIEKLTAEQEARFGEFVREWTAIGLSTEPADRPAAEMAVRKIYKIAGLKPPRIVWCGSPLSMALTRAIILKMPTVDPANVRDSTRANLWADVSADARANVWADVRANVRANVSADARANVSADVRADVWADVRANVSADVSANVWANVRDRVSASISASINANVKADVWANINANVSANVSADVWANVRADVWANVSASIYGQHDASWLGLYRFFHDVLGLREQTQRLEGLWELSRTAGWALPCRYVCFVAERHTTLHRDDRGRLHCETGPACAYPDGWGIYAIHGVRVPRELVEDPYSVTVERIAGETNSEVQRVMIERFGGATDPGEGWDRYLAAIRPEILDHDDRWGTLYRTPGGLCLGVINRSPEPDGSFRRYILPVADNCEPIPDPVDPSGELGRPQKLTALNAVASTFGLTGKVYAGILQAES